MPVVHVLEKWASVSRRGVCLSLLKSDGLLSGATRFLLMQQKMALIQGLSINLGSCRGDKKPRYLTSPSRKQVEIQIRISQM